MTMKYGLFPSEASTVDGVTTYDRAVDDDFLAEYLCGYYTDGVFPYPSSNFKVSAGSGMNLSIAAGIALSGSRMGYDKSAATIALDSANASLPRIDRIVFRMSKVDRKTSLEKKTGTAASSPTAPGLTRSSDVYELSLATVAVAAGATNITDANITDTRLNSTVCGLVSPKTDVISSADYNSQLQSAFNIWFQDAKDTLGEDSAGNLLLKINALQTALDSANTALTNYKAEVTAAQALREQIINARLDSDRVYKFDHYNIPFNTAWKNGLKSTDWGDLNSDGSVTFKKAGWYFCAMNIHCSDVPGYTGTFHIRLFYGTGGGNIAENYVATNTSTNSAHHMVSGAVSAIAYFNVGDVLRNEICGASMDYNYRIDYENSSLTVAPHAFV